ncbi:2TM domain-containing protein [Flagellimonas crocea]|uniref:2TM domain-containing protein n=1 Tax=Flagellimonas crocea TaxID=3067311 RepID=UPI00296E3042|nr:2TM domain-containing protein [Muricauda sp. DH64]
MNNRTIFENAQQKVRALKRFYTHLVEFCLVTIFLLVVKEDIVQWVSKKSSNTDEGFLRWLDWNILAIPIIWAVVIAVHGLKTIRIPILKNWEERQINKILEKDYR